MKHLRMRHGILFILFFSLIIPFQNCSSGFQSLESLDSGVENAASSTDDENPTPTAPSPTPNPIPGQPPTSSPSPISKGLGPQSEPLTYESNHVCEAAPGSKCYYVAANVDPNATLASPYGTRQSPGYFHHIIPLLQAGDYLYVLPGSYVATKIYSSAYNDSNAILTTEGGFSKTNPPTADKPVTIKGLRGPNGEKPVLNGQISNYISMASLNTPNPRPGVSCVYIKNTSHLVIDGLIVTNCYNSGIYFDYSTQNNIKLRNLEIYGIYYFDNGGFITVKGVANIIIENSVFHDYSNNESSGMSYLKFFTSTNVTVRNNYFYGQGAGMYYKHGETGSSLDANGNHVAGLGGYTKIHNNIFYDLTGNGIYTNQNRTEIYNNLFQSVSKSDVSGISIHQEDGTSGVFTYGVQVHHNTFVRSGVGFKNGTGNLGARDGVVQSNIFYNSKIDFWVYGSNANYSEVKLTSNNNCFFTNNNSFQINYFSSDNFGSLGDTYTSLSSWKSSGLGHDQNSVEVDPLFNSDFSLKAESPCQNRGAIL